MKLFYDLMCQPSRAIFIFFKVNKIPAEFIHVDLRSAQHLSDDYKAINRFQKVPSIVDDDGWQLAESIAIFKYLMSTRSLPSHWCPTNARSKALIDEYLQWHHNNLRLGCAVYFQISKNIGAFSQKFSENDDSEGVEPIFKFLMDSSLDQLENIWLADEKKRFLAIDELTFADILAACEIEQPKASGVDVYEGRPKLKEWHERVRNALNPAYDEAHVTINKVIEKQRRAKL